MANKAMKTLTIGSNTYEIVDETARNSIKDKVDKVDGKALSTNDFTNSDKEKLNNLYVVNKVTDEGTSIDITVVDNTEYRFPNATTVNITCPDGEYECWMRLGASATAVSITNAVCMTSCSLTPEDLAFGGGYIEISIKDGIYIIQKVE